MTAATLAPPVQLLAVPGGVVAGVDLWFPGRQDPAGRMSNPGADHDPRYRSDPDRYLVWVPTGRGRELAPRKALHVGLRPAPRIGRLQPGVHDCDGCRP